MLATFGQSETILDEAGQHEIFDELICFGSLGQKSLASHQTINHGRCRLYQQSLERLWVS